MDGRVARVARYRFDRRGGGVLLAAAREPPQFHERGLEAVRLAQRVLGYPLSAFVFGNQLSGEIAEGGERRRHTHREIPAVAAGPIHAGQTYARHKQTKSSPHGIAKS